MTRSRSIALAIAGVSLAALALGGRGLALRIGQFNEDNPPPRHLFHQILTESFVFADRPVEITSELDDNHRGFVELRYGDENLRLKVTIPPLAILPDLTTHADWLAVLVYREAPSFDPQWAREQARDGIYDGRLILVTRTPPPGVNPKTFGEVWRSDWWFDFYELGRDGTIEHSRLAYPQSERAFARRVAKAKRAGEPVPQRKPNELREGTWQYEAAMRVVPPHFAPPHSFRDDALSAAGWTLPVVVVSTLTLLMAIAFGFGPQRRRTPGLSEKP